MIEDILGRLERLEQSIGHVLRVGVVTSTNPATGTARVQFPDADGLVSYDFPVLQRKTGKDKDYHMPDAGEHVACLCLGNGLEQGCIVGALYSKGDATPVSSQDKRHTKFSDGTFVEYDRASHTLSGEVKDGNVVLTVGKDVNLTIKGNPTIKIEGATALEFGGKLTAIFGGEVDVDFREKVRRRFKEPRELWTTQPEIMAPYQPLEGGESEGGEEL